MATINAADFVKQPYVGSSSRTRNKAIPDKLAKALAKVAQETGVTFVVESGAQDNKGEGTRRTGSTRHDEHTGAADVMAKDSSGNFIDFSTPAGKQQWSRIVQLARAEGITGIGAGSNYMGTKTVHLGYGNPAVWSSVKSGQPVEPWLQTAYTSGTRTPPLNIPDTPSTAVAAIDAATRDQFSKAGFNPGSDATPAIMAFQRANGLKPDGIVGDKTRAALQRATIATQQGPSPVPSRGVVVAPPSTGSAFRGGWGSNGFILPGMNRVDPLAAAPPGSATGGGVWPPPMVEGPGIDLAPAMNNVANAFAQPTAVASVVDVPRNKNKVTVVRAPKQRNAYVRAPSGRSQASVGETFDSVWNEAKGDSGTN